MKPRPVAWVAAALVLVGCFPATAHDVIVEQRVDVLIRPSGEELVVQMHMPISAVAEAKLPVLATGALDAERTAQALEVVAADVARNFDLWQNGTALPYSRIAARVGADRRSIDLEFAYATTAGDGFSARLNAFTGTPLQPVRTNVQFIPPSGASQTVSVIGPPIRIDFDPDSVDVMRSVAAHAVAAVLSAGDHVLWLLCVLLPIRRARQAATIVGALIVGQLVAILGSAVAPNGMGPFAAVASLVAASAIIMSALQTIVRAGLPWVLALTAAFGLLNGLTFGGILVGLNPFAGSHQAVAFAVFPFVVASSELWIAAVAWSARTWLASVGIGEGVATIMAAALIAHAALHRMLDRGSALVQNGVVNSERVLTWITLGWAAVMVAIAIVKLLRQSDEANRTRMADPQHV